MGARANLIAVTDTSGGYELHYDHWGAEALCREFFWGPARGLAFVRKEPIDGWLDEVWAEGGAVLDLPRKVLLFFGGDDILFDVPLRRRYLSLLRAVWEGWDVRWAHEGVADLADYVGVLRETVLDADRADPAPAQDSLSLNAPKEDDWVNAALSIRWEDGSLRFYPFYGENGLHPRNLGPYLLAAARQASGYESLDFEEWTETFPASGIHIDAAQQTLDAWDAQPQPEAQKRLGRFWPAGWKIAWHQDRFESQLERSEGRLNFPRRDTAELTEQLREILGIEATDPPGGGSRISGESDGSAALRALVQHLEDAGEKVLVNPSALETAFLTPLTASQKRAIWEKALYCGHDDA